MATIDERIPHQELLDIVEYCPITGKFTAKVARGNLRVGDALGYVCGGRYIVIHIKRKNYLAHRLAWLYVTGEWSPLPIDHINGVKTDNRICNLRIVSTQQNAMNLRVARPNNKLGVLGVSTRKKDGKFIATINVNGKTVWLGAFESSDVAHQAYLVAKREFHSTCTI